MMTEISVTVEPAKKCTLCRPRNFWHGRCALAYQAAVRKAAGLVNRELNAYHAPETQSPDFWLPGEIQPGTLGALGHTLAAAMRRVNGTPT